MHITDSHKKDISAAIVSDLKRRQGVDNRYSQTRHATYLGINTSVYSRIVNGDNGQLLSESEWIRVGIKLRVDVTGQDWKTAITPCFSYVSSQMDTCRQNSVSRILIDEKGIGKTHTARDYAANNSNVLYINCGNCATRLQLIREIAKEFGFEYRGRITEVRENLINNIRTLNTPLVILDDAGYLKDEAFLEWKSLFDELEYMCGWYLIGDHGLQKKIERLIFNKRIGYESILDRMKGEFQSVTGQCENEAEVMMLKRHTAELILKQNLPRIEAGTVKKIIGDAKLQLRALRDEVIKYKGIAA